jgi:hypothetical protein
VDVLLIRSSEVDEGILAEVLDLLQAKPGPLRYESSPEPLYFDPSLLDQFNKQEPALDTQKIPHSRYAQYSEESMVLNCMAEESLKIEPRFTIDWNSIFSNIEEYRKLHGIAADRHVILLTDHHNENNWFCSFDPSMRLNYFIQSSLWHEFIDGGRRFPIAYECIAMILQRLMFDRFISKVNYAHREPRGCMMDFCISKDQIALKLRTADICSECLEIFSSRGISTTLINQALSVFESIRGQMLFCQRFISMQKPSRIRISAERGDIHLIDLDDTRLNFSPLQKVVYLFLLKHPEGVPNVEFGDHFVELMSIYRQISNAESESTMQTSIRALCDPLDNSLNEKISKIRRTIKDMLGEALGSHYQIIGSPGSKRRISLARQLIAWEN